MGTEGGYRFDVLLKRQLFLWGPHSPVGPLGLSRKVAGHKMRPISTKFYTECHTGEGPFPMGNKVEQVFREMGEDSPLVVDVRMYISDFPICFDSRRSDVIGKGGGRPPPSPPTPPDPLPW